MNAAALSGQAAAGSADALLGAVHWLCRHHGIERSADSLLDGLGVPRPLTPAGACQVLEHAGLVSRRREAQRRPVHLEAEVFDLMTTWIERYRRQAEERYRRLDALLATLPDESPGEPK